MRSWSVHWTERERSKVEQEKRRWKKKRNLSYFLSFQGSLTSLLDSTSATCMTTWPAPIIKSEVSNLVANVLVLSLALRQDLCRMKKTESNSGKFNVSPGRTKIHCLRGHYFVSLFFSNLSDVVTGFSPKSPYGFYWEILLHSMVQKNIISWSCLRGMTGWLIDWFRIMQYS